MKKRKIYFPIFLVFMFLGFCLTSPLLFRDGGVMENIEYYAMLYVSFLIIICVGVYILFVRDEGKEISLQDISEGEYWVELATYTYSNGIGKKSDGLFLLNDIRGKDSRYFIIGIKEKDFEDSLEKPDFERLDRVIIYKEQGKKKIKKISKKD